MFISVKFKTSVQLTPAELTDDLDNVILKKLSKSIEGICTRHGYVKPGSINIIKRSCGKFVKQHFNGQVRYEILCSADVCNPSQGSIYTATIKNKNALGLLAESYVEIGREKIAMLDIIIPKKAAGIISEIDLETIKIGEDIYVMVIGKRYQMNDKKISIIGRAVKSPNNIIENQIIDKDLEEETEEPEEYDIEESDQDGGEDQDGGDDTGEGDNPSGGIGEAGQYGKYSLRYGGEESLYGGSDEEEDSEQEGAGGEDDDEEDDDDAEVIGGNEIGGGDEDW